MYHILVIDDYTINGTIVKQALNPGVYDVKIALSGREGLEYLSGNSQTDVILLDISMPDMDGVETLIEIRKMENYKETPIIFVTGQADRKRVAQGFKYGIDDIIAKPVKSRLLNERVERVLRGESPVQIYKKGEKDGLDKNKIMGMYSELIGDFMDSLGEVEDNAMTGESGSDDSGEQAGFNDGKSGNDNMGIDFDSLLMDENIWGM